MSLLSSFFKSSKKTNLTPDVTPQLPSEVNPMQYKNLSDLANRYINGVGTGFGNEFVDKTTNPVAASMRRNFQNITAPTISSNYSSRGLGRSSLAANAQGNAEGDVESNVGNLMAQFYQLNEAQKKTDTQFGASVGQNLLTGDTAAQHVQADASAALANATNKDAMYRQGIDTAKAEQFGQAGASLVAPILNNLMPQGGGMPTVNAGGQNYQTSTYGAGNIPQGMPGPTTQILGATDKSALLKMLLAA